MAGAKPKMNVRKIDKINSLLGGLRGQGQLESTTQRELAPAQHVCVFFVPLRGPAGWWCWVVLKSIKIRGY